ncbi:MFS transporter [Sphingomonas sp. 37zxx]|uniref:MFS transporter n=1 Tax=Sphingomonas sp. 37zxx TaxID=1550073 RepID=UPI000AAEC77C|nr:MFS transporter [Sphingomonas sp. 37zxx]
MTPSASPALDRRFLHLALTETAERFSLHGMKALLTLYLVNHVLAQNPADYVGLTSLRAAVEGVTGPLTPLAFASQLYGLYAALTYLVLPVGGWIGDRWIGRRGAVIAGALLIGGGHLCLGIERWLVPGLALVILGTGAMKANLSAQVGALFPPGDARRERALAIYLAFLNVGVMLGPLVSGWLAQRWGWRYGFGAAAVAIGVALLVYLRAPPGPDGQAQLRPNNPAATQPRQDGSMAAAVAAILVTILAFCAYEQVSNLFLVWVDRAVQPRIGDFAVPAAWFVAADGLFTILLVIAVAAIGRWRARRGLAMWSAGWSLMAGCAAMVAGYGVLAIGGAHVGTALAALILLDLGVVLVWPAALGIVTGAATSGRAGMMVGMFFLHGFVANLVVGRIGGWYETMSPSAFWLLHAAIAGGALLLAGATRHIIDQQVTHSTPAAAAAAA